MDLNLNLGLGSSLESKSLPPAARQPQPLPPMRPQPPIDHAPIMVQEQAPTMLNPGIDRMVNARVNDGQPRPIFPHPVALPRVNNALAPTRPARERRRPNASQKIGKLLPAPSYPWAKNHRAKVHSLEELAEKGISIVFGNVKCKHCELLLRLEFNIREKFDQIGSYMADNNVEMNERAPVRWMNPTLPRCNVCGRDNSLKPVIPENKRNIDWLFLLLGEMLGCCSLEQLKYFCKHTNNHRTGAKNRILYLAYWDLCNQLDPNGPFHR